MVQMNNDCVQVMLVHSTKTVIMKIYNYNPTDVDGDGTRFFRGIVLRKETHHIQEFKLKCDDYNDFIRVQLTNQFRILSAEELQKEADEEEDDDKE